MPSRREMIKMTDAEVDAFLGGRHTMNVATFGPDGNIHLVAMWYGFLDGVAVIETFGKSQKVKNLRRDPRFTLLVEDGETYETLRGVEQVGRAEIIEDPDVVVASCRSVLGRYHDFEKPEDLDLAAEMAANKRVAIKLHVDTTVSWDHTKLDVAY